MSNDTKFFYANAMEIAATPYDISFKFVRNVPDTTTPPTASGEMKPLAADSSIIGMSPAHAKAMVPAIYKAIVEYERMFGKLGLPADMQANFDSVFGAPKA